jgi:ubiquinone/menaquinone biosynthesis C-methylase UbiE
LESISVLLRLRSWLLKQPLFTSRLLPAIPRPIRWMLRRLYFLPLDVADRLLRQRPEMVPPRSANFTGSASGFLRSGETLLNRLIQLGGIAPDSRILDIGCGVGRLAVPLTGYLTEKGSYDGLDIVGSGIKWCNENIGSRFPNFTFVLADVFNKEYHPSGRYRASEYRFPYPDGRFDMVVLASVFTHMLPKDMDHYVEEIHRMLQVGGRCFATYFLINPESRELMESEASSLHFKHDLGSHWLVNTRVPELSVGYDETYVREIYGRLFAETTIYYGGWCGREAFWAPESGLGDQDLLIATK